MSELVGGLVEQNWQAGAEAITTRMAELELGQQDLAARSGVSVATLRQMQRGIAKRRNARTVAAVSEALGWPAKHLETIVSGGSSDARSDRLGEIETEVSELRRRVDALESKDRS